MSRLKPSWDSTRTASARCALESCGREFRYDPADISRNPSFPFCSTRCKGADLGGWVTEEYRIEEPADPDRLPGPLEAGNEREHEKTGSDQDDADE
ncbi:DNA gyrase inhibitor YacG [bacterium]|nr:DNA gyrase inhibitor YacG [bacterium]